MTEIPNQFSIDGDLDEASEDDLRETVKDFMEKHEENVEAYEEVEESASEYEERAEEAEESLTEFKERLAEDAIEQFPSSFEVEDIVDKDVNKLFDAALEAREAEFSAETPDEPEGEEGTEFEDKPQKSRGEGGVSGPEKSEFAQNAKKDLEALGFSVE